MTKLTLAALIAAVGVAMSIGPDVVAQTAGSDASRFVGTWRLAEVINPSPNVGKKPTGLLFYDARGNMSVQIQPDRARASWPQGQTPTSDQLRDATDGYAAYFGTYTIDERAKTVTHHREGSLNLNDPKLVRRYEFRPDGTLALSAVERPTNVLIWAPLK